MTSAPSVAKTLAFARRRGISPWFAFGLAAVALGLQVFLPTLVPALSALNLPFLAAFYLVLAYRRVIPGMLACLVIGWAQDGLTHGPVGVYGLVYVALAYLGATASQFFKLEFAFVVGTFVALAYWLHELILFAIRGDFLLGQPVQLELGAWSALAGLHAGVALVIYPVLDRWRQER